MYNFLNLKNVSISEGRRKSDLWSGSPLPFKQMSAYFPTSLHETQATEWKSPMKYDDIMTVLLAFYALFFIFKAKIKTKRWIKVIFKFEI